MEEKIRLVLAALCFILLIKGCWSMNLNDIEGEEAGTLTCECSGKLLKEKLDAYIAEVLVNEKNLSLPTLGDRFRSCDVCRVSSIKCANDNAIPKQYSCIKTTVKFRRLQMDYDTMEEDLVSMDALQAVEKIEEAFPEHTKVPIGSNFKLKRPVRQLEACAYPVSMRTAELQCTIYPSSVKCIQRCAFGHTLPKGTEVYRVCNKRQDHWEPSSFEECKPYIDPGLTLVSGGSFTCTTPTVQNGPECNIRCLPYEDMVGTAPSSHKLNLNGRWDPPLPFCAQRGSGRILVPQPRQG